MIKLTLLHWTYLFFIITIIVFMIKRKGITFPCILGIFTVAIVSTHSVVLSIIAVFNGLCYALRELISIIFIISIVTAMSKLLKETGINELMIKPFSKFIKGPSSAYWIIGIIMFIISSFFWPSPATVLIGTILLPIGTKAGLPALAVASSMNLFGHGIALSGDYIIQGAPKLTSDGAGIPIESVINASIPLVIIMGIVTTVTSYIIIRKDLNKNLLKSENLSIENDSLIENDKVPIKVKKFLAILIYLCFLLDLIVMIFMNLKGQDATNLIGGTSLFILTLIFMIFHGTDSKKDINNYIIQGLEFGINVFGPVISIAAFFYLGDFGIVQIIGKILPVNSQGLINDLGLSLSNLVPLNPTIGVIIVSILGAITGLDGSGFSGISLVGSVACMFSVSTGIHTTATLTALGQISAIWVGGGTLIPWSLIAVSSICNVDPFELAKKNLVPVCTGFIVTILCAAIIINQ